MTWKSRHSTTVLLLSTGARKQEFNIDPYFGRPQKFQRTLF